MTISKKSTLLYCGIILVALVFFTASYFSVRADARLGMEETLAGLGDSGPEVTDLVRSRFMELEDKYTESLMKITLVSGGLIAAAVFISMCFVRFESLKPLKNISCVLENIKTDDEDLSDVKSGGGEDSFEERIKSFVEETMKAFAEAQSAADLVTSAAADMLLNADVSYKGLKDASGGVKFLSSNAEAQARGVESFGDVSAEFLKNYDVLSLQISEAAAVMDRIMDNKESGERSLSELLEKDSAGMEKSRKAAGEISGLRVQATGLKDIADELKDAAERTMLLSRAAWTEAVSAGECGKGFAAVAGAVGALAGRCANLALDIERSASYMAQISAESVEAFTDVLNMSEDHDLFVKKMREIFSGISSEIYAAGSVIGGVHKSLSAAVSMNAEMREKARGVQELGLENKRGAEAVGEAMNSYIGAIENIKDISDRVVSAMNGLKETLGRFETGSNPTSF